MQTAATNGAQDENRTHDLRITRDLDSCVTFSIRVSNGS